MSCCQSYGCEAPVFKCGYCGKCYEKQTLRGEQDRQRSKIKYLERMLRHHQVKVDEYRKMLREVKNEKAD